MNWEQQLYEEWKSQHPDVLHREETGNVNERSHQWYVRNYVEYRLLPALSKEIKKIFKKHSEQLHGGGNGRRLFIQTEADILLIFDES